LYRQAIKRGGKIMKIVAAEENNQGHYTCQCPNCCEQAVITEGDFCCSIGISSKDHAIIKCNEQFGATES
jgi:hypothetical protein